MGYDPVWHVLEIEFRNGEIYDYFDVPADEYAALCSAPSKGAYLNSVFKPKNYRVERKDPSA